MQVFTISGTVLDQDGDNIDGATITYTVPMLSNVTIDVSGGEYSFTVPYNSATLMSVQASGYNFDIPTKSFSYITEDIVQDFRGSSVLAFVGFSFGSAHFGKLFMPIPYDWHRLQVPFPFSSQFSRSSDFSENNLIVGADQEAYIFKRDGQPNPEAYEALLTPDVPIPGSNFGSKVAILGEYAFVSAPYENINGREKSGAVYVFKKDANGSWSQKQKIVDVNAGGGADKNYFGFSISAHGDYLVIGSPGAYNYSGKRTGAVFAFKLQAETWTQLVKILPWDNLDTNGNFGNSVCLFGDELIVGAPHTSSVYIFKKNGDYDWPLEKKYTGEEGSSFGHSVAMSGDNAIVGSPYAFNYPMGTDTGAIYVFSKSDNSWNSEGIKLYSDTPAENYAFGKQVDISGDYMICNEGYHIIDFNSAYIFRRNSQGIWQQQKKIPMSYSGVAISDGSTW